ncbi:MAG TPA: hypothetical protein VF784_11175 [Anaerolineales bacterium]
MSVQPTKSNGRAFGTAGPAAALLAALRGWLEVLRRRDYVDILIVVVALVLSMVIRYDLLNFRSVDFLKYTADWYHAIKSGGHSAFSQSFSNYNVPYLYLLYLVIRLTPDLPALIATKVPSLVADFVMAWLAYRIIRLKYGDRTIPVLAAFALLFAPTVVLNSAFWGQADALYTAALLGCLYCLLIRKEGLALALLGVAIAFKAQGVFLLPLPVALALRRELRWRHFLLVPAIMLLSLVPAWAAGRPLMDLLMIYPSQAGQYDQLSMHAPSVLSWIPDTGKLYPFFYPVGLVSAAAVTFCYLLLVWRSRAKIAPVLLVELATVSLMLLPFFLPKMHERYFYPADVFTILLAFYRPRLYYVPIGMTMVSFFAYQPTLFGVEPVPIPVLALGVLVLLVLLIRDSMRILFPSAPVNPDEVELGT